jgi:hypothetical protein
MDPLHLLPVMRAPGILQASERFAALHEFIVQALQFGDDVAERLI